MASHTTQLLFHSFTITLHLVCLHWYLTPPLGSIFLYPRKQTFVFFLPFSSPDVRGDKSMPLAHLPCSTPAFLNQRQTQRTMAERPFSRTSSGSHLNLIGTSHYPDQRHCCCFCSKEAHPTHHMGKDSHIRDSPCRHSTLRPLGSAFGLIAERRNNAITLPKLMFDFVISCYAKCWKNAFLRAG